MAMGPNMASMGPGMAPMGPMMGPQNFEYGAKPMYAAEETEPFAVLARHEGKGLDLLQAFPFTLSFLSLLVFLGAIVKMAYLSFDPNVRYWIGVYPMYVAFLPLAFMLLAYIIHKIAGKPSKLAMLVGLLGPSLLLFIGGYKVSMTAFTLSTAFASTDCITNPQMYQLGVDYKSAVTFMSTCKPVGNATAKPTTISDCAGYDAMYKTNPGWHYLAQLEKTSGCAGWCDATTTLWAYPGGVQDPCSSVASDALATQVLIPSMQVAIYNIVVLFSATLGMAVFAPKVADQGLNW